MYLGGSSFFPSFLHFNCWNQCVCSLSTQGLQQLQPFLYLHSWNFYSDFFLFIALNRNLEFSAYLLLYFLPVLHVWILSVLGRTIANSDHMGDIVSCTVLSECHKNIFYPFPCNFWNSKEINPKYRKYFMQKNTHHSDWDYQRSNCME